jgi:hypothetical protein
MNNKKAITQVVEHLLSMHEALGSILNIGKKQKNHYQASR